VGGAHLSRRVVHVSKHGDECKTKPRKLTETNTGTPAAVVGRTVDGRRLVSMDDGELPFEKVGCDDDKRDGVVDGPPDELEEGFPEELGLTEVLLEGAALPDGIVVGVNDGVWLTIGARDGYRVGTLEIVVGSELGDSDGTDDGL